MLGKRARAPMSLKRTISMTGITVDFGAAGNVAAMEAPAPLDPQMNPTGSVDGVTGGDVKVGPSAYYTASMLSSPRYNSRDSSADQYRHLQQRLESSCSTAASFLRTCGLCNRRLAHGRDIYMYRGDTAFCSEECREQRMKQDERKEKKYNVAGSKKVEAGHHNQYSELANAASESSTNTVAAA